MSNVRIRFKKDCATFKAGEETEIDITSPSPLNDVCAKVSDGSIVTINRKDFDVVQQVMYLPYGLACICVLDVA